MCNMAVVQMLSLPLSDRCLLLIGTSMQLLRFGGVLVISVNSRMASLLEKALQSY